MANIINDGETACNAAQAVADILNTENALIKIDHEDLRRVTKNALSVMTGIGEASGEGSALKAAQRAFDSLRVSTAFGEGISCVILKITASSALELAKMAEIAKLFKSLCEKQTPSDGFLWSCEPDEKMGDRAQVTAVAVRTS